MTTNHKDKLELRPHEAHHASICVALVWGAVAGAIAYYLTPITPYTSPYIVCFGYVDAFLIGVSLPWLICEYTFSSAHHWYGEKSWMHRAYDLIAVVTSLLVYSFAFD